MDFSTIGVEDCQRLPPPLNPWIDLSFVEKDISFKAFFFVMNWSLFGMKGVGDGEGDGDIGKWGAPGV